MNVCQSVFCYYNETLEAGCFIRRGSLGLTVLDTQAWKASPWGHYLILMHFPKAHLHMPYLDSVFILFPPHKGNQTSAQEAWGQPQPQRSLASRWWNWGMRTTECPSASKGRKSCPSTWRPGRSWDQPIAGRSGLITLCAASASDSPTQRSRVQTRVPEAGAGGIGSYRSKAANFQLKKNKVWGATYSMGGEGYVNSLS